MRFYYCPNKSQDSAATQRHPRDWNQGMNAIIPVAVQPPDALDVHGGDGGPVHLVDEVQLLGHVGPAQTW